MSRAFPSPQARVLLLGALWLMALVFLPLSVAGLSMARNVDLTGRLGADDLRVITEGTAALEQARLLVWQADRENYDTARELLERSERLFFAIADGAAKNYALARVEFQRGALLLLGGNRDDRGDRLPAESRREAQRALERAVEYAALSVGERESADGWRVRADAGAALMITRGLAGILSLAPRVEMWATRAMELDADNALASLILLQGQINTPKSFGGDPAAAVVNLLELHERSDLDAVERFWTRASLVATYVKLQDRDKASAWCDRAAEIFPKNPLIEECV